MTPLQNVVVVDSRTGQTDLAAKMTEFIVSANARGWRAVSISIVESGVGGLSAYILLEWGQ